MNPKRRYRFLVSLTVLFWSTFSGYTQNLLVNPEFEEINVCVEHAAECSPEGWLLTSPNIPVNRKGTAGIVVFNSNVRNVRQYMQSELMMELEAGRVYEIKIMALAGECVVNSLGVKFEYEFTCLEKDELIESPDVDFSSQFLQFSKGKQRKWIELSASYKAKGGERFILIGSFASDSEQTRKFKDQPKQYTNYLYFLDNVELNAPHLDSLPPECMEVKKHLYNFDYRHSFCLYRAYEKPIELDTVPAILPEAHIDSLILGDVLFDFNSSDLKPEAESYLLELMKTINKESISLIEIYGYTDNIGTDAYNEKLSQERAESVKKLLSKKGLPELSMKTFGMGKTNPVTDNSTEEGRQKNRRIEIFFHHSK